MLLCGYASSQETPTNKQAKTKTDSTYNKTSSHSTHKKTTTTKSDTVRKKHTQSKKNKSGKSTGTTNAVPQRKDTIGGITTP